jgi:5-methylcytosine-specific restriction protein A
MIAEISKSQWIEILQASEITKELDLSIFQTLYSFNHHAASSSDVGRILGYGGSTPQGAINLEIGKYAKRIAQHYDINFSERSNRKFKYWDLFFDGLYRGQTFVWQLKPALKEALEASQLTGVEPLAEEITTIDKNPLIEGLQKSIVVNSYERNPKARQQCIEHWGATCQVCTFDFQEVYGSIGAGFIHVHHLTPLATIGDVYEIDPIQDLIPVCPNCHAMLHRKNPPLGVEELKKIMEENRG